jgi:hypothetical protein
LQLPPSLLPLLLLPPPLLLLLLPPPLLLLLEFVSSLTSKFSGLTSLWLIPWACRAAKPWSSCCSKTLTKV